MNLRHRLSADRRASASPVAELLPGDARYRVPVVEIGHCRKSVRDRLGPSHSGLRRSPPTAVSPASADGAGAAMVMPGPDNGNEGRQARAGLEAGGVAAAIAVTRMKAVAPTATAPMIEKTTCHASEGMVCFTMPWVA